MRPLKGKTRCKKDGSNALVSCVYISSNWSLNCLFQSPVPPASHRALNIPELLEEVFMHRISSDTKERRFKSFAPWEKSRDDHFGVPLKLMAPLVFTRVCREWRRVALGNPFLWSRFCIYVKKDACADIKQLQGYMDLISSFLTRSRSTPLTLRIIIDWSAFVGRANKDHQQIGRAHV